MRMGLWSVVVVMLVVGSQAKASLVVVRYEPPIQTVTQGDLFTVDLVADIDMPVVGWGLDMLVANPAILSLTATPTIGTNWISAFAPDGDGLAGLANPAPPSNGSVMGTGIVLATLSFSADAVGVTDLLMSLTPNDLTEGFALDPTGFANVTFEPGRVVVIPEPSTVLLVISGMFVALRRRRRTR